MFGQLDQERGAWTEIDRRLSATMIDQWVAFARTGDPNGDGRPARPLFDEADPRLLELGETIEAKPFAAGGLTSLDAVYDPIRQQPNNGLPITASAGDLGSGSCGEPSSTDGAAPPRSCRPPDRQRRAGTFP
jgi:hypothetical protein